MSVTVPYDADAVAPVAALLGVTAHEEPYRVRGAAVWRLELANASLGRAVTVVLWPSLRRVDVRLGDCSMVYRDVITVELLPRVEVIFRRGTGDGYLFISTGGRASVVV
jgi:hypothetical protein